MSSTIAVTAIHGLFAATLQPSCPPISASTRMLKWHLFAKTQRLQLCTVNTSNHIHNPADFDKTIEKEGKSGNLGGDSSNQVLTRLKRYGISGVLAYGLLNTAYYLITFLVVWFYVTPAPGRMGYLAAVERFLKVMAMVWAGSQVTKLIRAGGWDIRNVLICISIFGYPVTWFASEIDVEQALALAPFVDRGLSWFTVKFKFESQAKAFMAIAGICFGLAFLMFLTLCILELFFTWIAQDAHTLGS